VGSTWCRSRSKYDAMTENPKRIIDVRVGPASGACPVREVWGVHRGARLLTGLPGDVNPNRKKKPAQAHNAFAGLS